MSEWKSTTLSDFISLQRGHDLPQRERRHGDIPVVGSGGITGFHDTAVVHGPGITIGRAANLGVPTLLHGDFWPLNTTLYVTDFRGNDIRFAFYMLQALDLTGFNSGSVQPMLNRNYIKNFPIRVPDVPEQKAVADILGALDDKIAVNEEILRTSRDLMGFKYENAVLSGVEATNIGAIADVFDGPHATPKKTESGPWFLSISSLCNGRLVLEESAHLADPDFEKWTRRVTPTAGDVLFSYETRLGEAALMPTGVRACLGRRMALMRSRGVGPRTLLQAFLSSSFQETIKQYSVHGATVDRILLSEFPSWQISLPIHESQQLECALRRLDEVAEQRERENETLIQIRETLLPKLMSGEVRVRDAEKVVEEVT